MDSSSNDNCTGHISSLAIRSRYKALRRYHIILELVLISMLDDTRIPGSVVEILDYCLTAMIK